MIYDWNSQCSPFADMDVESHISPSTEAWIAINYCPHMIHDNRFQLQIMINYNLLQSELIIMIHSMTIDSNWNEIMFLLNIINCTCFQLCRSWRERERERWGEVLTGDYPLLTGPWQLVLDAAWGRGEWVLWYSIKTCNKL